MIIEKYDTQLLFLPTIAIMEIKDGVYLVFSWLNFGISFHLFD